MDMMFSQWAQVPAMSMPVIEQFRGMCGILDQNSVILLEQVTIAEHFVNGKQGFLVRAKNTGEQ
jgi:hypothetical protein